jgi:uncharacterized membrane-anchored protein
MRCPVCKAENGEGPNCRRCKADLSLLFALEQQREAALAAARAELVAGRWGEARAQAEWADHLRRDEESQKLMAVAALMEGDFREAWRRYCGVVNGG